MKRSFLLAATLMAATGLAGAALGESAATKPSAERGLELSRKLCVNCHLIGPGENEQVVAGVPSFSTIANDLSQTRDSINAVLIDPHAPMPNARLTRAEIDDIIAYLDTLRDGEDAPPLMPPEKTKAAPQYPEPS